MPRKSTTVKAQPPPEKKYNSQGQVSNWSALWPVAVTLKVLVHNNQANNLTVADLKKRFTEFEQFVYGPLSSALNNMKKSFNKLVNERDECAASGGQCELTLSGYRLVCISTF
jgi:hypothetical protein